MEKNKQTVSHRIKGCIDELKQANANELLKEADCVYIVSHSQGAVIATILTSMLFDFGILNANTQKIGILSMSGIHHGTLERMSSLFRNATAELRELALPTSSIFKDLYLPALRKILLFGVIIIAIASFKDRVVSPCSATIDGIRHPNIFRGLYVHPRYHNEPTFLLASTLLSIKRRNQGKFDDFSRFLRPSHSMATGLLASVGEILINGNNVVHAVKKSDYSSLSSISLDVTKNMWSDIHSHSEVHECEDVFRFGFNLLLKVNSVKFSVMEERKTFDEDPAPEECSKVLQLFKSLEESEEAPTIRILRELFFMNPGDLNKNLRFSLTENRFGFTPERLDDINAMKTVFEGAIDERVLEEQLAKSKDLSGAILSLAEVTVKKKLTEETMNQ